MVAPGHKVVDRLKHLPYVSAMTDHILDATGLLCPLPVLKARKRLMALQPGEVLRIQTDDPAAIVDVPHFCAEAGHDLLDMQQSGDSHVFEVRKGAKA